MQAEEIKMKKIFIFGGIGSGKTSLAKEISRKLNLPYYSTDNLIFNSNWERVSNKERDNKLKKIIKSNKWIIEGTHKREWILPAFKKADFVVILSISKFILIKRIISRHIKRKFKKEPANNLLELVKWAYKYQKDDFPIYLNLVKDYKKGYIILKSNKEINNFLNKLREEK